MRARPHGLPLFLLCFCAELFPQTWTVRVDSIPGGIEDMLWTGDRVLAADRNGAILSSPDGAAWTTVDSGEAAWSSLIRSGTGRLLATSPEGPWALSEDGTRWTRGKGTPRIHTAAAVGGAAIAADSHAGILYISEDDTTWTRVSGYDLGPPPDTDQVCAVGSNGKIAVATGFRTLNLFPFSGVALAGVSGDGKTWRFRETDGFPIAFRVAWAKDRFFALHLGTLASSPDGETWTAHEVPWDEQLYDAVWTGRRFVAVGSLGVIRISDDGNRWESANYLNDSLVYFNKAVWTGSRLILAGVRMVDGRGLCRYIITLDDDNLLGIRSEGAVRRSAWTRKRDWLLGGPAADGKPGGLRLFDIRGRTLRMAPVGNGTVPARLPLSGLGRGNYLLRIDGAGKDRSFLIAR